LTFCSDGKALACISRDSAIGLLDVTTGKELRRIGDARQGNSLIAFSPDGKTIASAPGDDNRTITLWELATGKEAMRFQQPPDPRSADAVLALAFSPDGRILVSSRRDGMVYLWEVASGKNLGQLRGHLGEVQALAFSADGRVLASGSADTSVLLWDVTGRTLISRVPSARLARHELESLWSSIASDDAIRARQALWELVAAAEQSVPFMKERLRPVGLVDAQRIAQLLLELDSAVFADREKASRELERQAELAEPLLRKTLAGDPSPEVRRRIEGLLSKLQGPVTSSETLRSVRAVEVLEHIATPEAHELLRKLAAGGAEARLTGEAKAALERLRSRPRLHD
jgi:hypothetical protein